ncbi:hypothetical protein CRG98_040427 [Punica granatum]|uniref:F-box domain-containing protein n=1 Tax=Punica granatum TaxID=22663 RepID=A0A2I0I5E3_PUNGR|nr:hypothetical protein CRG98_040427 [Punica granatum]
MESADNDSTVDRMSPLPEHIFPDILLQLPDEILIQLKCVSNRWRELISSSHFSRAHLACWRSRGGVIYYVNKERLGCVTFDDMDGDNSSRMFYIYYWNEMSDNKFFEVWALEDFNKPVWFKHQVLEDANKFFFLASWWTNKIKLFAYDTTSKNWRSAPSVISPFYGFYSAGHVNSLISWSWTSSALLI